MSIQQSMTLLQLPDCRLLSVLGVSDFDGKTPKCLSVHPYADFHRIIKAFKSDKRLALPREMWMWLEHLDSGNASKYSEHFTDQVTLVLGKIAHVKFLVSNAFGRGDGRLTC